MKQRLEDLKNCDWGNIGLLTGVPEERIEYVTDMLNETLVYVNKMQMSTSGPITRTSDDRTLSPEQVNEIQMILFPIITRITTKVDMTLSDLKNIYATILFGASDFIDENKELALMGVDLEAHYIANLCDEFIESRKNVEEVEELEMNMDLRYLTEKRDDALEHFNNGVKQYMTKKGLIKRLDGVLRINRQLKMMERAVVISALARTNKRNK